MSSLAAQVRTSGQAQLHMEAVKSGMCIRRLQPCQTPAACKSAAPLKVPCPVPPQAVAASLCLPWPCWTEA